MSYPTSSRAAAPHLRASDADRERVAAALRRHHLDGRLDTDELQDRLGRCYAARTTGELAALLADLPADEPPPGGGDRARAPGRAALAAVALTVVALVTLTATAGAHAGPFPFLAIFLLIRLRRGPRRRFTAWSPRV